MSEDNLSKVTKLYKKFHSISSALVNDVELTRMVKIEESLVDLVSSLNIICETNVVSYKFVDDLNIKGYRLIPDIPCYKSLINNSGEVELNKRYEWFKESILNLITFSERFINELDTEYSDTIKDWIKYLIDIYLKFKNYKNER